MLKIFFISISTLLILTIFTGKFFIFNCNSPKHLTQCGLIMAFLFALYTINALILMVFIEGITSKIVLLLLGISPYIIGKLSTYKNLNIATILQIILLIIGILYIVET